MVVFASPKWRIDPFLMSCKSSAASLFETLRVSTGTLGHRCCVCLP